MATGERRLGTSRRGMTVLGKIPMPSVPKPINLPSQRSENRGLEPNVEIVPRGTFSWGNAGNNIVANVTRAGASGIASSPPTSSGAWNGGFTNPTSGNDVVTLAESSQLSSSSNGTRPLSAPTIARSAAWGGSAKSQAHVQVQSSGFTVVPLESATPKLKESLSQDNVVLGKRPTSSDGTVGALELHRHPGAGAYAGAGLGQIPSPKGLQDRGDDHYTSAKQGMPSTSSELPAGAVPHPGVPPHEACFRSFGMPHYGSPHNRDMVLVRMVNNPGAYEGYQPHLTPVECVGQSGVYGNYRPQISNTEQFPTSGRHAAAGGSGTADIKVGNFPSGNKFFSQGREEFCNSGQDIHKYKDGQFGTVPRDWGYFGLHKGVATYGDMTSMSTQRNEWNHTMQGTSRSRNHLKEAGHLVKQEVPEKKITLLMKTPRVEAQKTENSISNATLVPDCHEGSETLAQERKKAEESEVRSTNEITNSSFVKQDINGDKEELLGETGKNKVLSAGINTLFPTLTSAASNETVRNEDSKVHSKWDRKGDAESHRGKSARQARKAAMQGGLEPVGADGQPACETKQIIGDDVAYRDGQRLKIKAPNHLSEKAWRPKSPVVDSVLAANAFSAQAAKREKMNEKHFGKPTDRTEYSQGRNTGDTAALDASMSLQNKKARKRRNTHSSNSVNSSIGSKVEGCSFSAASNECATNELTICEVERDTLKDTSSHACNTAGLITQDLSAEALSSMEIEGMSQKKAKGKLSCQKAEKEWRPKSPALEVILSTDSISQSEANEASVISLPVSDGAMKSNNESKILEQEGLQVLGTYDYEGQRERLKIAAQRAKQLRQEEEERAREQRAKALAKLEELERRKLANSTSLDVLVDEAPTWKAKKRPTSSRRPSADILLPDFGKQHMDETASVCESPASPMVDNKEVASSEETVSHNSRNKRDRFDRNSLTIMEDRQVCEPLSGTSSQGQINFSRRDPSMGQIGLLSDQDTEADSLSNKKHEVKKDEVAKLGRPRRQKGGMHNQVRQDASNYANKRSVGHLVEEPGECKLQLTEPIAASDVDFLLEKVGRLHVSWRQKNSHGHPFPSNRDTPKSDVENELSALEESIDAPTQSRKPRKIKNGGKQSNYVQQRPIQFEGCVTEERFPIAPGSAAPELIEPNATSDHKCETGVNSLEQGKDGGSRWRQKNGRTGSHASKSNSRSIAILEATDEAHEGILDSTTPCALSSSQTSFLHNPRNIMKHFPKAASGASQWHKMKSSAQEEESGYHVASEENTGHSASWHRFRLIEQCGDEEHEHGVKLGSANRSRKRGVRPQAEAKLSLGTTDYKYQEMRSLEVAEGFSALPISGKNRLNHTNAESHRTIRQHQPFTHDRHHEADFGYRGEQRPSGRGNGEPRLSSRGNGEPRPSSRGNKPSRQRQFNGCSSVAELDRRDAESAIKTGISC